MLKSIVKERNNPNNRYNVAEITEGTYLKSD